MRYQRRIGLFVFCSLIVNVFAGLIPAQKPGVSDKAERGLVFRL